MRPNGFIICIDMALREVSHPLLHRYREAMILGTGREDVAYIPGFNILFEHLSLSHFYRPRLRSGFLPFVQFGPLVRSNQYFKKALAEFRKGRRASAFVQIGRILHLLVDMACPVHAQGIIHETDPFEWSVEAMREEFSQKRLRHVGDFDQPSQIIEGLALFTQDFRPDKTNNGLGKIMRKLGHWKPVKGEEARSQAREIIPVAAGYTAALFRLLLRRLGRIEEIQEGEIDRTPGEKEEALRETLTSLELPAQGVEKWMKHIQKFCHKHGGTNHYRELLALTETCLDLLEEELFAKSKG